MVTQPSVTTLRVVTTVVPVLAMLATAVRLAYRRHRKALWWDDAWAGASMAAALILLTGMWVRSEAPGVGPVVQPHSARVTGYILVAFTYSIVLWFARMSILFSIIRIVPSMTRMRRTLFAVAFLFGVMFFALIIQKSYICFHDRSWEAASSPQCHLGRAVGVTELTTDFVADAILIGAPLNLLWDINLPRNQRTLLFVVFSTSILTTLSSIVHGVMLLGPSGVLEAITAHLEAAVSLIVCNLSVIVTFLYRYFYQGHDLEKSETPRSTSLAFKLSKMSSSSRSRRNIDVAIDVSTIISPGDSIAGHGRGATFTTSTGTPGDFLHMKAPADEEKDGHIDGRDSTYTLHFSDKENGDKYSKF